jgi:ribose-phosphate pyrophosphokinase
MMADHFARRLEGSSMTVVSPDVGGIKRAQLFREFLQRRVAREVELAFIEKRRAKDVVSSGALVGDSTGRDVVVIDDLCASGSTLVRASDICHRAGAKAVHVAVTHTPLTTGVQALLSAEHITSIAITDSVGFEAPLAASSTDRAKMTTLSIAPLFGQAARRMLAGKPVAPLLERWPVLFED